MNNKYSLKKFTREKVIINANLQVLSYVTATNSY